ncbi:hypothetical protein LCGC14_0277920 [marine sediment metagenome]|uniref:Uncharacterized protein n=1 Tax=marine sediment metagenome TaxID=412755 RepID=A0A0F9X213_9ZZZZ
MTRKIKEIAAEIRKDWKKVSIHAEPYLGAMEVIESADNEYYWDSAASVTRYFLSNATTWKGEVARRIKKELNEMIEGIY